MVIPFYQEIYSLHSVCSFLVSRYFCDHDNKRFLLTYSSSFFYKIRYHRYFFKYTFFQWPCYLFNGFIYSSILFYFNVVLFSRSRYFGCMALTLFYVFFRLACSLDTITNYLLSS